MNVNSKEMKRIQDEMENNDLLIKRWKKQGALEELRKQIENYDNVLKYPNMKPQIAKDILLQNLINRIKELEGVEQK